MRTILSAGRSILFIVEIIGVATLVAGASAQPAPGFSVHDSRPLVAVSDILERVMGMPVNYEDTLYRNKADSEDIQGEKYGFVEPGYQLLIPRRGTVSGALVASQTSSNAEKKANIEALLNSYRSAGLPGDFGVEWANGMFYIVPTKTLAANGASVSMSPVMSVPISFPRQERTVTDTIQLVLNLAGQSGGVKIGLATLLFSPLQTVQIGATSEAAKDVLQRIIAASTSAHVTYRLLSMPDPKGGPDYLMSMQYTGSAPWASTAQVTGYPLNDATDAPKSSVMSEKPPVAPAPPANRPWFRNNPSRQQ